MNEEYRLLDGLLSPSRLLESRKRMEQQLVPLTKREQERRVRIVPSPINIVIEAELELTYVAEVDT